MTGGGYYIRLAAALVAAGLLGLTIANPAGGRKVAERASARLAASPSPLAGRPCVAGEPVFREAFAAFEDVLSVSPLGVVTAPGEPLPAPFIRINTKKGESFFDRRVTTAVSPARADIVAIERRSTLDDDGVETGAAWTLHFRACGDVAFVYDDLDDVAPAVLARAGGLGAFAEIGGPERLAVATQVRVKAGEAVGRGDGFDVGVFDFAAPAAPLEKPDRYKPNPYVHATATHAPEKVLAAVTPDYTRAQCPLSYLPKKIEADWSALLGDAWGVRKAKGAGACRTALVDLAGTAQGAWFTDAAHNGLASKISAVALAPDAVDPSRLVFALHGRLRSLNGDFVAMNPMLEEERAAAARDFLTFETGEGRINTPFAQVKAGAPYCYQGLRANFVGPRINGVVLLELGAGPEPTMKIEARADAAACADLKEPWSFTGDETTFYR